MYDFSARSSRVKGSVIRELFKLMADPEIISLGGGSPASESFDLPAIRKICDDLLATRGTDLLQYGVTPGWMPLREAYIEHLLQPKQIAAQPDNVVTFTGSTQGIHLTIELFVDEGDVVLVENPTFLGTLNVLKKFGAQIVPLRMDDKGLLPDDLEAKARQYHPKLLYTIPTFQNPTGRTLPEERRRHIAELSAEYNFVVLEDDPYGDVRFRGTPQRPIKHFDQVGNVVLMNSFSKIVAPGLRVGACCAAPEIAARLEVLKQGMDTHTALLTQAVCAEFLSRGMLPGHLEKIADIYRERHDTLYEAVKKYFPDGCTCVPAEGGMFLWVDLPQQIDATDLLKRAVSEEKVAFVPGAPFCVDPEDGRSSLRLNFSGSTPDCIEEAVCRIGRLLDRVLD